MRFSIPQVVMLNPPQTVKRGFAKAQKAAVGKAIRYWHSRFLPRHFRAGAFGRYGYGRRTTKYQERKERRFGHRRPLVRTGLTQDQATRWIYVRGTSKMMTGRMTVPWYIGIGRKGRGPDLRKELLTTTREEGAFLRTLIDRHINRAIGARHHRKVVTF